MNERNYGIDALRIVSILMVISLHILGAGGVTSNVEVFSPQYVIAFFLQGAAFCAVNCFALISGYVGVKSRFKVSSIVRLWLQVVACMLICTAGYWYMYPSRVKYYHWIAVFTPIFNGGIGYWYYSAYFFMSLFIPLMNRALLTVQKGWLRFSIGSVVLLCMLSVFFTERDIFLLDKGYSPVWLAILYMLGGYIRLHGCREKSWKFLEKYGIIVFLCMALTNVGFRTLADVLRVSRQEFRIPDDLCYRYISVTIVVQAMALLAWFSMRKPGRWMKKLIAFLAPSAFSVYLLHNQELIANTYFWEGFKEYASVSAYYLPVIVIGKAMLTYVLCTCADCVRRIGFRIINMKRLCRIIDDKAERLLGIQEVQL